MRVFVPRDDPVKVVELWLQNASERSRRLTITYYAELVLGASRPESQPFTVHEYDEETGSILARNPWTPEFAERTVFLTSGEPAHGVTVDRTEFLGPGGSVRRPAALERWGLSGCVRPGVDPCRREVGGAWCSPSARDTTAPPRWSSSGVTGRPRP